MANFTINQAKVHAVAFSRCIARLHKIAARIGDIELTSVADDIHAHGYAARQTLARGFGVPPTTIAPDATPDGGVKPPSAS